MQRTRNPQKTQEIPSLILCSDFHLREDTPTCWTGNFLDEQTLALGFIYGLQLKHNCPVIHTGDLFDHWKPSPWLISYALGYLPHQFYTIYGQHDLPQHNWELRDKSGIYCLEQAGKVKVLEGCHYGQSPEDKSFFGTASYLDGDVHTIFTNKRRILPWHHLTYITPLFPKATGGQATGILHKYPQFDLIVTGDNHQSFFTELDSRIQVDIGKFNQHGESRKRILVNPGSLTRQTADQIDFQPRVALWYAESNTIEWVNIPIQKDVITREHIERVEKRDERIDAFVSRLDKEWEVGLSFEQNLAEFFNKNQVDEPVKQIIYKAIE